MIQSVIPGRAQREPGIQGSRATVAIRSVRSSPLDSGFRLQRPRNDGRGLLLVILSFLFSAQLAFAAPTFPPLTGRVVDNAHILSAQIAASIDQKSAALQAKTGHQFVVVTLPDLQGYDIAEYGYQLGRAWGIGSKANNDGVILIVAPTERKVRIEVGYGLEPILTDALSSVILQSKVLPKFRAGDMEGGVADGADAIITQLGLDPADAQKIAQAAASKPAERSSGIPVWIIILIVFFVLSSFSRRRRYGGGGLGAALPWIILSGMGSRGRDGGWGGGGGSFGGGGSSGGW